MVETYVADHIAPGSYDITVDVDRTGALKVDSPLSYFVEDKAYSQKSGDSRCCRLDVTESYEEAFSVEGPWILDVCSRLLRVATRLPVFR